jgi:hypothetical protein
MVLVLATVEDANLGVLENVFEAMLQKFKVDKDIGAMRVVKSILEKIRMELALRQKKVKSAKYNLTIPNPEELKVKFKGMNKPNAISIIQKAMTTDLKTNPMGLQKLGDLWASTPEKKPREVAIMGQSREDIDKELLHMKLLNVAQSENQVVRHYAVEDLMQTHGKEIKKLIKKK